MNGNENPLYRYFIFFTIYLDPKPAPTAEFTAEFLSAENMPEKFGCLKHYAGRNQHCVSADAPFERMAV